MLRLAYVNVGISVAIIATIWTLSGLFDKIGWFMEVTMLSTRINARLSGSLAAFVGRMVGEAGLYETPSEYVRDLIRRDMDRHDGSAERESILAGYRDLAAGRVMDSTGDFQQDMKRLAQKEDAGWR